MPDVTVTVIGAGISGSLTGLKSAKKYKVRIPEAGKKVLPVASSSHNECYKLHTGAHFLGDLATAKHCLQRSVVFAREFPNFLVSDDLSSPWRRGRHYIMSNSLVPVERTKAIVLQLQADYAQLVAEDERNKVFGESEDFIKFLSKEDYPYIADTIPFYDMNGVKTDAHVVLGIETAESQIDIDKLQAYVQQQIEENPNITFMPSQEVTRIVHDPSALGYLVTTKDEDGIEQTFKTRTIVNCAWQNIETLNNTLGLPKPDDERVVRIKVSVLIELPESLRNMNTCLFSSGPYASITVLPNGTAVLTSERWTNAGSFKAGVPIPAPIKELLDNLTLETTVGQDIAKNILFDCASYVNEGIRAELEASPIKELRVGFVKIRGSYTTQQSIYQANSCIHARLEDGVEELETGFIVNAAMKMTYAASNATIVNELLDKHMELLDKMDLLIACTKKSLYSTYPYLRPLSELVDFYIYTICRSLIEDKVRSLAYERDAKQCINELAETILKKMTVFILRRYDGFFSKFCTVLNNLVEDKIASLPLVQEQIRCPIELSMGSVQKSNLLLERALKRRRCSFFSEDRLVYSSSENSVEDTPIPSPV